MRDIKSSVDNKSLIIVADWRYEVDFDAHVIGYLVSVVFFL
jgi:hypothetical protein